MTEIQIMWAILGAVGTSALSLIGVGIVAQVKATINNTKQLAVVSSKLEEIVSKTDKISKLEDDVKTLGLLYRDQKEIVHKLSGHQRPQ